MGKYLNKKKLKKMENFTGRKRKCFDNETEENHGSKIDETFNKISGRIYFLNKNFKKKIIDMKEIIKNFEEILKKNYSFNILKTNGMIDFKIFFDFLKKKKEIEIGFEDKNYEQEKKYDAKKKNVDDENKKLIQILKTKINFVKNVEKESYFGCGYYHSFIFDKS
jgi:hypothetical protein